MIKQQGAQWFTTHNGSMCLLPATVSVQVFGAKLETAVRSEPLADDLLHRFWSIDRRETSHYDPVDAQGVVPLRFRLCLQQVERRVGECDVKKASAYDLTTAGSLCSDTCLTSARS